MTDEHADVYNARLVKRTDLNDELALFDVAMESGEALAFEPGQYTTLGLIERDEAGGVVMGRKGPKLLRRAYSIASPPRQTEAVSFYIVHVEGGALTTPLWELAEGDRLFMDARAKGNFTLDGVPSGKDLVMVGTGTGLAPFVSMYDQYREAAGGPPWRRLVMFDGCRLIRDLGYHAKLTQAADFDDRFVYLPTVTREPEGPAGSAAWGGLRGRVTDHLEPEAFERLAGFPLVPESAHVFLCGNPAMIDQVEAMLVPRGFVVRDRKHPEGNLHFERYW